MTRPGWDEFGNNSRESGGPRPGYVQAEDGSWVPRSFYGNQGDQFDSDKAYAYNGQVIEW